MNLVIDASVAIKWFVVENLHDEAKQLLGRGDDLYAPDLLVVELANVAWKKAMRGEIDHRQAREIAVACLHGIPALRPSSDFIDRAAEIALDLRHPIYDCLYVACAESVGSVLVTADSRLWNMVKDTKFKALVMSLDQLNLGLMSLNITTEKINELIELSKVMRATERNVYNAFRSSGEFNLVNLKDMEPYWNSPCIRRMHKFFNLLTDDERADLLALMWLGQGYSGEDWQAIRERAGEMIGSYANDNYIYPISRAVYLEQGMKLFRELMRENVKHI
ncbi:MAG: PIN domain-containing protein [Dongiaceae bacterium]